MATTLSYSRLIALAEANRLLTSDLSLDVVLERLTEAAADLTHARYAALGVLDASGTRLERFITHGLTERERRQIGSPPRGLGILGVLIDDGRPLRLRDLNDDPRAVGMPPGHPRMQSFLGVPITLDGVPFGNLYLTNKDGGEDFTDEDQELVVLLAAQAAVAIELSERVARDSLRRVVGAQELERRRLARELHDETGQSLTSILLGLRSLENMLTGKSEREAVAALREHTVRTLQSTRRLAEELRPKALDDFGLTAALERFTSTFAASSGLEIDLAVGLDDAQLPGETATALYRIVQEALTNVVKHAEARHASILLTGKNGRVALLIEDDGRGFDLSRETAGFGLVGMRERAELLGGTFDVESRRAGGTTIAIEVPS